MKPRIHRRTWQRAACAAAFMAAATAAQAQAVTSLRCPTPAAGAATTLTFFTGAG